MTNIFNLTRNELEEYFISIGEKKYKAAQVFSWLYEKRISSFLDMSDLKKDLQLKLSSEFRNEFIKLKKVQKDEEVRKYLFQLNDGNLIEAVLMIQSYGNSVCVSSQVGCNMGCTFCESGRRKKIRDLEAYEMVQQVLLIEKELEMRISSVVIMGIGEPMDNYDNVLKFVRIINDDKGIAIGARHITISTCGIIPGIKRLQEENLQINLALSLHAPNDELRNQLMNINKVYSISQVIAACKEYILKTNRRITVEYVMLEYVNDDITQALELANLLKGMNVYVNLIPYNETSHELYKKSKKVRILAFYDMLKKNKINVTIRREFGKNIAAACGQLRSNEEDV